MGSPGECVGPIFSAQVLNVGTCLTLVDTSCSSCGLVKNVGYGGNVSNVYHFGHLVPTRLSVHLL